MWRTQQPWLLSITFCHLSRPDSVEAYGWGLSRWVWHESTRWGLSQWLCYESIGCGLNRWVWYESTGCVLSRWVCYESTGCGLKWTVAHYSWIALDQMWMKLMWCGSSLAHRTHPATEHPPLTVQQSRTPTTDVLEFYLFRQTFASHRGRQISVKRSTLCGCTQHTTTVIE